MTSEPLRAYLDASASGGPFDQEFAKPSKDMFDAIFRGAIVPIISETLVGEIAGAPQDVQDLLDRTLRSGAERVPLSPEAVALRSAYLAAAVVTEKYGDDAMHVAQATLVRADVVASWNFRHLVNPARVRAFNGVNVAHGYGLVVILTPADLVKVLEAEDE